MYRLILSIGWALCCTNLSVQLLADELPSDATIIRVADSSVRIATWNDDSTISYAIDDGNGDWHVVENTSYELNLRFGQFDPLNGLPAIPALLSIEQPQPFEGPEKTEDEGTQVFIVQFKTQPIAEYRQQIRQLGGTIYKYLPRHAYLVRLDLTAQAAVAQLPYIRWIGLYQPAYKLDEVLVQGLLANAGQLPPTRVNIMVHERGIGQKNIVAARIAALGGKVDPLTPNGFRLVATLDGDQLVELAALPEVMWVDLWSEPEVDMDKAREIGGANHIEKVAGYSGQGVRGEVFDTNLFSAHIAFQTTPPIFHGPRSGDDDHGTGTYGITFSDGTGDAAGRGMIPSAQGIFADFGELTDRYAHTAELLSPPYEAVFQSNSWGSSTTTSYTSISAEIDDIIFINDILITQSQSNTNSQFSRPQAWAKNVVSVGGIRHLETVTKDDDFWDGASIGPAADGRVKPDLAHFYDTIYTTDDTVSGYRNFCCTSGATPIVGGHFGLLFQMWSDGIFGNSVDAGASVFANRPHSTTARAIMFNNACSWPFTGTGHNLTRTHQGWGLPDLTRIHDLRANMFIVNEEIVLQNLETATFDIPVNIDTPDFRATLVYIDPMGMTAANQHRINDLSLKVTSPTGNVYWGNNGLLTGNWSIVGGSSNSIDPVENVLVQNPAAGTWTVEVIAFEINEDSHLETGAVDADFALVVTGVGQPSIPIDEFTVVQGDQSSGSLEDAEQSDDEYLKFNASVDVDPALPPVLVVFDATLGDDKPSFLSITVEAAANTVGLTQTIEMFNYASGAFVQVDEQPATVNSDGTVTVDLSQQISSFVEPSTGRVKTRLGWRAASPTLMFPWKICVDQVTWHAN